MTGDITDLSVLQDSSVDVFTSTLTLHHLPDRSALEKTFAEISRVLRPGGNIYLIDFGRLKSLKSMRDFAYRHADRQPELFTLDYLYSLQAAFTVKDFRYLADKYLHETAKVTSTFLMPFMITVKSSTPDKNISGEVMKALNDIHASLPAHHKTDLADLIKLFSLGGLPSPLLRPSSD